MEYRLLGKSGLKVSVLSFGTWVTFSDQTTDDVSFELIKAAIEAGINFFDTAEVYGSGTSEEVLGRVLKRGGWKRSDLVISTKVFWGGAGPNDVGLSRKHVIEGVRASLKRLQLDYVDIVFAHRPDYLTPVEETVRAMNWLIDQGLTFYWGTSEWPADRIREAFEVAGRLGLVPPLAEQPQYNLLVRKRFEVEDVAQQQEYARFALACRPREPLERPAPLQFKKHRGSANEGGADTSASYSGAAAHPATSDRPLRGLPGRNA